MAAIATAVREYMSSPVHTVRVDATLLEADARMRTLGVSALVVVNPQATTTGILSRTDIFTSSRLRPAGWGGGAVLELDPAARVADAMRTELFYAAPRDPLSKAATTMVKHHVHRVVVMDDADCVGVLSTTDVMRAVAASGNATPVNAHMHSPIVSVEASERLRVALDRLEKAHVSGLVVLDEGWPVGIFTRVEALAARDLPVDTPVDEVMSASTFCVSSQTPVRRAAAQCATLAARRLLVVEHRELRGVMTGIDFARVAAGKLR